MSIFRAMQWSVLGGGGGRLHLTLPRMCGLKLEGNGYFVSPKWRDWRTLIWVSFSSSMTILELTPGGQY